MTLVTIIRPKKRTTTRRPLFGSQTKNHQKSHFTKFIWDKNQKKKMISCFLKNGAKICVFQLIWEVDGPKMVKNRPNCTGKWLRVQIRAKKGQNAPKGDNSVTKGQK